MWIINYIVYIFKKFIYPYLSFLVCFVRVLSCCWLFRKWIICRYLIHTPYDTQYLNMDFFTNYTNSFFVLIFFVIWIFYVDDVLLNQLVKNFQPKNCIQRKLKILCNCCCWYDVIVSNKKKTLLFIVFFRLLLQFLPLYMEIHFV